MKTYAVLLGIPALLLFTYSLLEVLSIIRPTVRNKMFAIKLTCLFTGIISVSIILMIQEPIIKDFEIFRLVFVHEKCGRMSYVLYKFLAWIHLLLYTPIYTHLKKEWLADNRIKQIHALKSALWFRMSIAIIAFGAAFLLFTTTVLRSAILYGPEYSGSLGSIARKLLVP